MPRRVSLPSAEDLFRRTEHGQDAEQGSASAGRLRPAVRVVPDPADPADPADERDGHDAGHSSTTDDRGKHVAEPAPEAGQRRPSGRVRHDEKMTVYVTAEELIEVEQTRLTLRARHGLAVDRGRLVREAVAIVLADYDAEGADSALVGRLSGG